MLSKQAIHQAIEQGLLKIAPFNIEDVAAAHINLHLFDSIELAPKQFALAKTSEKITLSPKLSGLVEGKSSLAKQGISIEQSSHFLEPETDNDITLEMFNASEQKVTLRAGQEIAKLLIFRVQDQI